jgi:hypothetical protein
MRLGKKYSPDFSLLPFAGEGLRVMGHGRNAQDSFYDGIVGSASVFWSGLLNGKWLMDNGKWPIPFSFPISHCPLAGLPIRPAGRRSAY